MPKPKSQVIDAQVVNQESDPKPPAVAPSITSMAVLGSKELQDSLDKLTEQRKIIKEFVDKHLVEGTDYGVIEATSKSGKTFKSKPTLFKPGMEKLFSLFTLTTEIEPDTDTLDMLKSSQGLVAYKCIVYRNGQKVAEGRGAATIGDMSRDANSTIKIAEKRARMDACLSIGFSEYFTQDMDDPEYRKGQTFNTTAPKKEKGLSARDALAKSVAMLAEMGFNHDERKAVVLAIAGISDLTKITSDQIRNIYSQVKEFDYNELKSRYLERQADVVVDPSDDELTDEALEQSLKDLDYLDDMPLAKKDSK